MKSMSISDYAQEKGCSDEWVRKNFKEIEQDLEEGVDYEREKGRKYIFHDGAIQAIDKRLQGMKTLQIVTQEVADAENRAIKAEEKLEVLETAVSVIEAQSKTTLAVMQKNIDDVTAERDRLREDLEAVNQQNKTLEIELARKSEISEERDQLQEKLSAANQRNLELEIELAKRDERMALLEAAKNKKSFWARVFGK